MQTQHYIGIGILLMSVAIGHELFSEKRNKELIVATGDATTQAVTAEFATERDRDDIRRDREHSNLVTQTRQAASTAISEQFDRDRLRREAREDQNQADLIEQTRTAAAAAVSEQFQKERDINEARAQQARQQNILGMQLSEGLVLASRTKMLVAEHYMISDELPGSNRELNMPSPREFSGKSVSSLAVSWGGVITIYYNRHTGIRGGEIVLRPKINRAVGLQWTCESDSFEAIERFMPQCRYTG